MTSVTPAPDHAQIAKTNRTIAHVVRLGIGVNVMLGFAYLIMLNGLATQGFDLENLKASRISLQRQVEVVDISLAIPSSIYALESNEFIQEMPAVAGKGFLQIRNVEVASDNRGKN